MICDQYIKVYSFTPIRFKYKPIINPIINRVKSL